MVGGEFVIGAVGLCMALALLLAAWWLRRRTGLPWQRVAWNDAALAANERPLIAREHGLVGKPDYILEVRGCWVPVEVKPTRRAAAPYASDLTQLAAYCVLVESTTGQRPPYGLLRYAEHTFKLPFTQATRQEVLGLVAAIRADLDADDVARSHQQRMRCRGCGFAQSCTEALA